MIDAAAIQSDAQFAEYQKYRVQLIEPNRPFCVLRKDGILEWNFHAGQRFVMQSQKRIIAAIAGRQGGKTRVGPPWLFQEMRQRGPGLYMVVAPSYPILQDSAIRWFTELFDTYLKLGKMRSNPPTFVISKEGERRLFNGTPWAGVRDMPPTFVRFGHAANPQSLEAKTALAAWLDEAGQDGFKLASWEAVEGRLTTTLGRVLITTTPYNLGWLKQRVIDPWETAGRNHPDIDVVSWSSTVNPAFSKDEYERLKGVMPRWKWEMFYNGKFTVPAGLIYGIMQEYENELKFKRSDLPLRGQNFGGLDFGGQNTCAVMARRDSEGNIYLYRTYHPQMPLPIREHIRRITQGEQFFDRWAGGAKSEGSFREEFWQNGLRVEEPEINDLQQGIDRVYALIAQKRLRVCDDLEKWWQEVYEYQYETDPETGDVLPDLKIKNKGAFHHMDATRYLCSLFSTSNYQTTAIAGGERTQITDYNTKINSLVGIRELVEKNRDQLAQRVARSNGNRVHVRATGMRRGKVIRNIDLKEFD